MTAYITVTNQKGGVGKTSLAIHIAAYAHGIGKKTLLVDMDSQCSSTLVATGSMKMEHSYTAADLWDDEKPTITPVQSRFGFDILPGSPSVTEANKQPLATGIDALQRLQSLDYDLIVFDTPPAPGVLQYAPLCMGGLLVCPIIPDMLAVKGLVDIAKVHKAITTQTIGGRPPVDLELLLVINFRKLMSKTQEVVCKALRESAYGKYFVKEELTDRELVKLSQRQAKPVWQLNREDSASKLWASVCSQAVRKALAMQPQQSQSTTMEEAANG